MKSCLSDQTKAFQNEKEKAQANKEEKGSMFEHLQVSIRLLNGRTHNLVLPCENPTIYEIKQRLSLLENTPVEKQKLVYAGQLLSDKKRAHDYAIVSGVTLHLILKLAVSKHHGTKIFCKSNDQGNTSSEAKDDKAFFNSIMQEHDQFIMDLSRKGIDIGTKKTLPNSHQTDLYPKLEKRFKKDLNITFSTSFEQLLSITDSASSSVPSPSASSSSSSSSTSAPATSQNFFLFTPPRENVRGDVNETSNTASSSSVFSPRAESLVSCSDSECMEY